MNAYWGRFFNLLSAVIGGGIAGYATIRAQNKSIDDQRKRGEKAEAALIHGFVQAIADELKSVWDRYNVEIGPHLKALEKNKAVIVFPVHQNYFVVFDSSASLIGRVPDKELRQRIISTYVEAKGFVDSLHHYEHLVGEYNVGEIDSASMLKFSQLVEYSQVLKETHCRLETKFKALQDSLQAYLD